MSGGPRAVPGGSAAPSPHEIDHVFVCCAAGAPEADVLRRLGLTEGSPNTHPGQGTACRRFFFENAYLELIWVHDAAEATSAAVAPTRLFERWSNRGTSANPFGLVFRSGADPGAPPPFETWAYRPSYLPPEIAIGIATGTPIDEPELFYFPRSRSPRAIGREPTTHAVPTGAIAGVAVERPGTRPLSPAARAIHDAGLVSFSSGEAHLMTLTFGAAPTETRDLRPDLPLVLRW